MLVGVGQLYAARVIDAGDRVYIQDQTGVRWDVTQAKSLGFKPEKFQYGIGKYAFETLDDTHIRDATSSKRNPRVIGIAEGDQAQAYSVPKLRYHEIANTHLGDKPLAVGYWPLVNLAAVYSRTVDGQKLTLAPSGWTYKNTFVLYDKETETLWYPYSDGLRGIQGPYFNHRLPKISSKDTRWEKWQQQHPDSKILD